MQELPFIVWISAVFFLFWELMMIVDIKYSYLVVPHSALSPAITKREN